MRLTFKLAVLRVARGLGIFHITRLATARQLRILCYHGVGSAEDVAFEPGLFMTLESVRRRFEILRRGQFQVLPLERAVAALRNGSLPRAPVVITFDDGLFGNLAASRALYREFAFPMTLYVTTYSVLKQTPVFRMA